MKTFADPVRNYLSAVERESSALPAARNCSPTLPSTSR